MVTRSCAVLIALLASLVVPVTGPPATAAPATFVHPGVVVSRPQLDFVRTKVLAGAQPWKLAYDRMMASKYADLNRTPKPRAVVECGPYTNPNYGCTDEREDAIAAYTLSLAWYVTRDNRYAAKAIQIMDAWSATIRDHTNSNAPLQTAWSASSWPKAAEIIKHLDEGVIVHVVEAMGSMDRKLVDAANIERLQKELIRALSQPTSARVRRCAATSHSERATMPCPASAHSSAVAPALLDRTGAMRTPMAASRACLNRQSVTSSSFSRKAMQSWLRRSSGLAGAPRRAR